MNQFPYANPYGAQNPYANQQTNAFPDTQLLDDLTKALNGEYSAIQCYEQLAKRAGNDKERERIQEIRQDEIHHYRTFAQIFMQLTGRQPSPQITEECPKGYCQGLAFAVEDEQKTVDFYNEIADRARDPHIHSSFARAALDEQNHAVWFLYFYTKHCRMK